MYHIYLRFLCTRFIKDKVQYILCVNKTESHKCMYAHNFVSSA